MGPLVSTGSVDSRGKTAARHAPTRSDAFNHLSIEDLRAYRQALAEEENRVSYWRRIIQARLDVVRAGEAGAVRVDNLRNVLAEARVNSGRRVLITVLPVEDIPPLPDLAKLWEREPKLEDPNHNEALARDLAGAETAYTEVLTRKPDHAEAAVNLGVVRQEAGDLDGAMEAYARAYRLRPQTFGTIAMALTSGSHGRLWLDENALRKSLGG